MGFFLCRKERDTHHIQLTMNNQVYIDNGFANRKEYLKSLASEYGAELVIALTSVLPASEDFDGLVSELEDNFEMLD